MSAAPDNTISARPAPGIRAPASTRRANGKAHEHVPRPSGGRSRHSGRRPGESGTREAIFNSACAAFAAEGYDRATIRAIAARAGVDPALVLHYFGSKEQLFGATLELPITPSVVLREALAADAANLGETAVRTFLNTWEAPEMRPRLIAMVRSASTNDTALAVVRDYLGSQVFGQLTETLGVADADLRVTLVGSQFIGLAMLRYVMRIEPIASVSIDQLAKAVGPAIQRYLNGDLEKA
jgi:AcrR family transcriptional regulator